MSINTLSEKNSSTTPIASGGAFTGVWEDGLAYDSITVAVSTDQNGYYEVQFSPDGTNVDSTLTGYYRTSLINPPHRFTVARKWFRIRFFNTGSSAQSYFRLQVMRGDKTALNVPLAGTVSLDYDATAVRPTDFDYEATLGRRQGVGVFVKFGYNEDIDTAATETVWAAGGTYTPLTAAASLEVLSSSTSDTSAGTGARTLLITGVNDSGEIASAVVTMNGTSAVAVSGTWFGVNRAVVLSSGSTQSNVGNITIRVASGGATQAYIPADLGVTQQCIYITPAGYNALIDDIWLNINKISGGGSPRVTVNAWAFNRSPTATKYMIFRATIDTSVENTIDVPQKPPLLLSPTDVFWLEATTDTNNTAVTGRFSLVEFRQAAT